MPRPLRPLVSGGVYHVMNRGASGQDIFLSKAHRTKFLKILKQVCRKYGIEVHAYCLMGNHYHLLIRTPEPNLDRAMQELKSRYARYFNDSTGRDGSPFRSRYRSVLVHDDEQFLTTSRYISRNPIDLGVTDLASYRWSSFAAMLSSEPGPPFLTKDFTLELAGGPFEYERFVRNGFGLSSN